MGFYEDQVLPRFIDKACGLKAFRPVRERVVSGVDGTVLELGFGSGHNVPHYPDGVERLLAVDPATVGRKLAADKVAAAPFPVDYVGLDGASLPVDDATVDHVVSTFTLCTIPDVERALDEVRRVLKPGGTLRFLEHGRSPDDKVARWQDRWNPAQKALFGGCHVNRAIDRIVEDGGLRVDALERRDEGRPKVVNHIYEGTAVKP